VLRGCLYADRANDGNSVSINSVYYTCSATTYQLHPWWAVELGSPLYVDAVDFTNRKDCCGESVVSK